MAKQVSNDKQFLVIKAPFKEFAAIGCGIGNNRGVCDYCNKPIGPDEECYYIAVLNMIKCEKCYDSWIKFAKNFVEDRPIEQRNFDSYRYQLIARNLWNNQ